MRKSANARFAIKNWEEKPGAFESGQAKESYSVIPGSATGDLRGLQGGGSTAVGHGLEHPFTLDYELLE